MNTQRQIFFTEMGISFFKLTSAHSAQLLQIELFYIFKIYFYKKIQKIIFKLQLFKIGIFGKNTKLEKNGQSSCMSIIITKIDKSDKTFKI